MSSSFGESGRGLGSFGPWWGTWNSEGTSSGIFERPCGWFGADILQEYGVAKYLVVMSLAGGYFVVVPGCQIEVEVAKGKLRERMCRSLSRILRWSVFYTVGRVP